MYAWNKTQFTKTKLLNLTRCKKIFGIFRKKNQIKFGKRLFSG